jgi:DHA1 family bicyclomycin/chloramphenicol resistance-like MFS transporter
MGAIQLGIGAISTALVSILNNGTAMPMAAVMCACAIGSFLVLMIGRRKIRLSRVNEEFAVNQ